MSSIISFELPAEKRREFIFRFKQTTTVTAEGKKLNFPSIVLYHRETGIPAAYPGFERWLFEMKPAGATRSSSSCPPRSERSVITSKKRTESP